MSNYLNSGWSQVTLGYWSVVKTSNDPGQRRMVGAVLSGFDKTALMNKKKRQQKPPALANIDCLSRSSREILSIKTRFFTFDVHLHTARSMLRPVVRIRCEAHDRDSRREWVVHSLTSAAPLNDVHVGDGIEDLRAWSQTSRVNSNRTVTSQNSTLTVTFACDLPLVKSMSTSGGHSMYGRGEPENASHDTVKIETSKIETMVTSVLLS